MSFPEQTARRVLDPTRWRVFVAALITLSSAATAHATGTLQQLTGYGLRLAVDTRWVDGPGYRPVRVTFTPLTPVTADRSLTFEFFVKRTYRSEYDLRVRQFIEIPAGSGPVSATIDVPGFAAWHGFYFNVYEDGVELPRLCLPSSSARLNYGGGTQYVETLPAVLLVDETPDLSQFAMAFPSQYLNQNPGYLPPSSSTVVAAGQFPTAFTYALADMPEHWIDLSSVDIVYISIKKLRALKAGQPRAWRALLDWTAAGGNLWISGVAANAGALRELHELVQLPAAEAVLAGAGNSRGWRKPDGRRRGQSIVVSGMTEHSANMAVEEPLSPAESPPQAFRPSETPDPPPFVLRSYDHGLLVALAAENPFPGRSTDWSWLLNSMGSDRWLWYSRHGLSVCRDNEDFWNLLIPGVGLPPVTEFCILISVFVLVIGPLNYWFLRRKKRLHLLVITIPGGAAAVTLSLFLYAVMADGLGTRVRARSATFLDQRSGQSACWSRLSYYAGLAPAGGLTFPDDVVVLPLELSPTTDDPSERSPRRDLLWDEGQQHLASGWLSARTLTQYVTVRARTTGIGLDFLPPQNAGAAPRIRNRLGTPIEQLLLRAGDGQIYWAEAVAADAIVPLTTIDPQKAAAALHQRAQQTAPRVPPEFSNRNSGNLFGMSRRHRYYYYMYRQRSDLGMPTQSSGRLEKGIAAILAAADNGAAALPAGSYIAVVERAPDVDFGVPAPHEEQSYHIVFGRW